MLSTKVTGKITTSDIFDLPHSRMHVLLHVEATQLKARVFYLFVLQLLNCILVYLSSGKNKEIRNTNVDVVVFIGLFIFQNIAEDKSDSS